MMKALIVMLPLFLLGCAGSPVHTASLNSEEIKSVSDEDLCFAYSLRKKFHTKIILNEIERRGVSEECNKLRQNKLQKDARKQRELKSRISRREIAANTPSQYDCPATEYINLNGEDSKTIGYLVNKRLSSGKAGPEPVCIEKIKATDVIKLRGNKVVKYEATILFPYGYKVECARAARRLDKKNQFSWTDFTKVASGGCGIGAVHDPLGGAARPGERKILTGEDEI